MPTAGGATDHRAMSTFDLKARELLSQRETPYGSVGVLHAGADLNAWWIWKDREDVDPAQSICDREDLIYVASGALRLELQGRESVLAETGQTFVIPADTPFRGYRWPRDGAACLFLAVAPADATFSTR